MLVYYLMILGMISCSGTGVEPPEPEPIPGVDHLKIIVDPSTSYQEIQSFGASDAWSIQFVGKNYPLDKKEQLTKWLFSTEMDGNGNPEGIGLSTWRFNLGAGSDAQAHGISDSWRRAETFYDLEGINSEAQQGQQWFIQAAKSYGLSDFTAFVNSPPVALTRNGYANSDGGINANISPDNYLAYADYLTDIDAYFKSTGISLSRISPFNEPQWDWKEGQEGSPWTNTEMAAFTRILDQQLSQAGSQTKIDISEAAQLDFLYSEAGKGSRANQIQAFFDPNSSDYVGDIDRVGKHISGHSYYTTFDEAYAIEVREKVKQNVEQYQLEFIMSEYCILEGNSKIDGNGRDLGMESALYMARLIQTDLVVANAISWQWWLAVSPYDYKDGLIYIDKNKSDSELYDSKLLWTLGQFSRFIRPGALRVKTSRSDFKTFEQSITGLSVSAYQHNGKTTIVCVNQLSTDIPIAMEVSGGSGSFKIYQTSAKSGENLSYIKSIESNEIYEIPANSVVTFVNP